MIVLNQFMAAMVLDFNQTTMKRYTDIPECWEEFTPRQFKYLLKSVFKMMANDKISPIDVLRDLADFMLGRKKFILPWQQERYLALVSTIADHLEWIFSIDDGNEVTMNYTSTQNPLPAIDGLIGPQSHGADLRFGEYRAAVDFFNRFTQEHDSESLDCLVGILYRNPQKGKVDATFDGQYREPFNPHLIGTYCEHAKHLDEHLKWGIYLWFSAFCKYLIEGGIFIIEGNEVSFGGIFHRSDPDPDVKVENSIGMMSVLFTLADSHTFGTAMETDDAELFKVLLKLLHDKQAIDNLQKQ